VFRREINKLLLHNVGFTIEQIGDIDRSHLLQARWALPE
jgi:hypothetical protein